MKTGIRITSYDNKGKVQEMIEFTEKISFNKGGCMATAPSVFFNRLLDNVGRGGALFIERIWIK